MRAQWKKVLQDLNATFKRTKKSVAFEGMIVTSDTEFFEKLGWRKGEEMPPAVIRFFSQAYKFAIAEIGYHGTDVNILSAVVHVDEKTPHLQLYYVPVVDTWREKVYALDKDGKVLRNSKGSPVQAKDENGKSKTKLVHSPHQPKVCRSDFWAERGNQLSFGNLQDSFHEQIGTFYGLGRGEVGSNRKHTTKYQWQTQQREKELAEKEQLAKSLTAQADEATARRDKALEELKPLQEYLDSFHEAMNGTLPLSPTKLRKMIVGLTTEYKQLEEQKKITDRDKSQLFAELQKLQKQIPELEKYKDFVSLINTYAPEKLDEAHKTATERKYAKPQASNSGKNYSSK